MTGTSRHIAIFGAGSWGTALAMQLARAGNHINLWDINLEHLDDMAATRFNNRYLPGIPLDEKIHIEPVLEKACVGADLFLIVTPSHVYREFLGKLKPFIKPDSHIIWASKGLEPDTGKLLHQVVSEELPLHPYVAVVSGPTFAIEVANNLPTAVTVASPDAEYATDIARALHSDNFRAYTSPDIIGVELGGALKNVLAIATGIADGMGFGANTRAALVTRGLAEIMRLGMAMGGKKETFMGLAGLGDLVLTCTDDKSRNRRMGLNLAKGMSPDESREAIGQAVEGIRTAREAHNMGKKYGIELPIIDQVYNILYNDVKVKDVVHMLLSRDLKPEIS